MFLASLLRKAISSLMRRSAYVAEELGKLAMMFRRPLQCRLCKTRVLTRTASGYGSVQEYTFPCPSCEAEICFGMRFDVDKTRKQLAPAVDYTTPHNAEWITLQVGDPPDHTLVFDPNHLVPSVSSSPTPFTPFIQSIGLIGFDYGSMNREQMARRAALTMYEKIIQLETHIRQGRQDLFSDRARELGFDLKTHSHRARWLLVFRAWENRTRLFRQNGTSERATIRSRVSLAEKSAPRAFSEAVLHYKSDDRANSIWSQLLKIRKAWVDVFPAVEPLYTSRHWTGSQGTSLDDWTLAQKRFSLISQFYQDCYETFCRLAVVAACVEGVNIHGAAVVPKSSGHMGIEEFELMPNGSKPDILRQTLIGAIFNPYIDSRLRNGVGHHSAEYHPTTDEIHYESHNRSRGIQKSRLSYVRFAEKVWLLYEQLETVSLYIAWIKSRIEGISGKLM